MAVGRDMKGKKNNVIAVIGDGAITGGMAYEAMNHAGFLDSNMIIILNDNQQVGMGAELCLGVCTCRGTVYSCLSLVAAVTGIHCFLGISCGLFCCFWLLAMLRLRMCYA